MVEKIIDAFDNAELIIEKGMHLAEKGLDAFFEMLWRIVRSIGKTTNKASDKIYAVIKSKSKILRYLGLPWTLLIPKLWVLYFSRQSSQYPILQPGMHFIRAKVGGGKSLLSMVLAEIHLQETGYASYFTSAVEKPRLSEDGKYWYVMHKVYDPDDYYQGGKKVMNFDTSKYKAQHKDEEHIRNNPRLNMTKESKNRFIPEHNDNLLMRHMGMDNGIYKYSQHGKLDSQDMDSLTYMHDILTKKTLPAKQWLADGNLRIIPVKIVIESYTVNVDFDGTMNRKLVRGKYGLPISYELLERFDTHAESKTFANLKTDTERGK